MEDWRERTERMIGAEAVERLSRARVALFGVGGVGGFAGEALIRAGIGAIDLFDDDVVCPSNLNRQLIALRSTLGRPKVEVMRERIADINPRCTVHALQQFYTPDSTLDLTQFDYIIDAIDTVTAKLHLISECDRLGVPLICSMGTGNKLDPTRFEVADIYKTSVCPLARVIRLECKKRRIRRLKVVYSKEEARTPLPSEEQKGTAGRAVPGSVSFVPPVAGMILAGEVIKTLTADMLP